MLILSTHYQDAFKHSPWKEARLLCFAGSSGGGSSDPEEEEEDLEEEEESTEEDTGDGSPEDTIADMEEEFSNQLTGAADIQEEEEEQEEERAPLTPAQLAQSTAGLRNELNSIHRMVIKANEVVQDVMQEEERKDWKDNEIFLKEKIAEVSTWQEIAEGINKWTQWWDTSLQHGQQFNTQEIFKLTDQLFIAINKKDQNTNIGIDITGALGAAKNTLTSNQSTISEWNTINADQKKYNSHDNNNRMTELKSQLLEMRNRIYEETNIANMTTLIDAQSHDLSQWLGEQKKTLKPFLKKILENARSHQLTRKNDGLFGTIGVVSGSMGIAWHSPLEYWEAFKQIKQAWTDNRAERTRQRSTSIAKGAAYFVERFMPYGRGVELTLDRQVTEQENTEKNKSKEALERSDADFNSVQIALSGAKTALARLGVLEYAASRGFLWDIEQSAKDDAGIVCGMPIRDFCPETWDKQKIKQTFKSLVRQNAQGQSSERQKGKSDVQTIDHIQPIIKQITKELQDKNFWAALGMAEAAIAKGKLGHGSAWIATTVMRGIQTGDTAQYVPQSFVDELGGLGLGHPGLSPQYFKFDRDDIADWKMQKELDPSTPLSEAGTLGKVIQQIEEEFDFPPTQSREQQEENNQLVARVLAGQLVHYNGKNISLFQEKFEKYRKDIIYHPYVGSPNMSADPDYFKEESEVILYGAAGLRTILAGSNESFSNADQALNFLTNVMDRHDKLEDAAATDTNMQNALQGFKGDMQAKFGEWIESSHITGPRGGPLAKLRSKTLKSGGGISVGEYAFAGLVKRDLLPRTALQNLIDSESTDTKGKKTLQTILEQARE
jgi:hypothetical protein